MVQILMVRFQMVVIITIAIAKADHLKTRPFENQTI